jgi:hypothetical protein
MEFLGLPFHAIVLHAAVVFTPLAAVLAVVFAFVPKWHHLTRWPTAVLTLVTLVSVWLSRISGQSLIASRPELAPLVTEHQERGDQLSLLTIAFTVVVAVAVWGLGERSGLASGGGRWASRSAALDVGVRFAVLVTAVLVLVWVVLTGDAGARAVWGG